MRTTSSGAAFAAASAAMVRGDDSTNTVHVLLADCLALLGADAAGVLIRLGEQEIELLARRRMKHCSSSLPVPAVQRPLRRGDRERSGDRLCRRTTAPGTLARLRTRDGHSRLLHG